MATLVCEPVGPIVPMLVAVTLNMLHPELSGRGLHERGPCSLRFRGHFLVFFGAPDARCDHSSVRGVVAHAHRACTAHGGYLCDRVAVGPDESTSKCHEFSEVIGGGLEASRRHASRGNAAAHVEEGTSTRVVYGVKAGAFHCNHTVARGRRGLADLAWQS
jgi:hypothetical protein